MGQDEEMSGEGAGRTADEAGGTEQIGSAGQGDDEGRQSGAEMLVDSAYVHPD